MDKNKDKTLIYVLFKEYIDVDHCPSALYFKTDCKTPTDTSYFESVINKVNDTLGFFGYEAYLTPVFDNKNVECFLWPYKILRDEFPNITTRFKDMLKRWGFTDHEDLGSIPECECTLFNENVTASALGGIASRQCFGNAVVIFDIDTLKPRVNPLPVKELYSKVEIPIQITKDIKSSWKWLSENRKPQRTYVFNEKHGDKYKKATTGSQLKTDCKETQNLLNQAVGSSQKSSLWLYDFENKAFIYFENQNEIRLAFHGYHINPGDSNYNNIDLLKLKQLQVLP